MVDARNHCSLTMRPRPRPVVLMFSDVIKGEETAGGGGGAEVEVHNDESKVEV